MSARRAALLALFTTAWVAPLAAASPGQGTEVSSTGRPSYANYQALLDAHLTVTSAPGEPLETRFHYRNLNQESGFSITLSRIRGDLFQVVRPSSMKRPERLAWAINAYNFLVLETVTQNFYHPRPERPTSFPLRVRMPRERVQQVLVKGVDLFHLPVVEVEGTEYNLNTFERHFVFDDFDPKSGVKPPVTLDPRAHFALVCAAQGCPPLRPRAYTADSLDAQLDRATRDALESPRHLRVDSGGVTASSIFTWYQADFGGEKGAFAFLEQYAPSRLRDEIARRGEITSYIQWDWTLNQTPLPEYKPPVFEKSP